MLECESLSAQRNMGKRAMNELSQQPPWEPDASGDPTSSPPPGFIPPSAAESAGSAGARAPTVNAGAPLDGVAPGRLPRVEALDLLGRMKATLVVGTVVAFGVFLGLAATHTTGVTARAAGANGTNSQGVSPTRPSDDGGFFTGGQNNGFGVGPPGSRGPASGTSVS